MKLFLFFLAQVLLITSCTDQSKLIKNKTVDDSVTEKKIILKPLVDSFVTVKIGENFVDIAPNDKSSEFKGSILMFQGYNFPKHDWCVKLPEFCEKLTKSGFIIIMPEMGRSVFADSIYNETSSLFKKYPLRKWVRDTLIEDLQRKYNILLPNQKNFLLGLSTGARGAALVALDLPHLFTSAALLSGDYDQSQMPNDKLMSLYYGPYNSDSLRWKTVDNVIFRIDEWRIPLYLGHGVNDRIVPQKQSRIFYDSLLSRGFTKVTINEPEMGHDYFYWGSESNSIIDFFKKF